ncbi:MAG: acyltransferase [Oceanicoccus sp.]
MNSDLVHRSAFIDAGVSIGEGTRIWHFSHVCKDSTIGDNCVLGQNTYIGPNTKIGNGVKIQNNVSVYEGVELEDDVFCGPSMVFTNVVNPRAFINRTGEFRKTTIRKGASLGANSTILSGITVGRYALVAAGATVTKNVPDFALVIGTPARIQGWVSKSGINLGMPVKGDATAMCSLTQERYRLKNDRCELEE